MNASGLGSVSGPDGLWDMATEWASHYPPENLAPFSPVKIDLAGQLLASSRFVPVSDDGAPHGLQLMRSGRKESLCTGARCRWSPLQLWLPGNVSIGGGLQVEGDLEAHSLCVPPLLSCSDQAQGGHLRFSFIVFLNCFFGLAICCLHPVSNLSLVPFFVTCSK